MLLWLPGKRATLLEAFRILLRYQHLTPAWTRLGDPRVRRESHNNSGISAKEQEELSACWLRYPPLLLFVQERSHVPAEGKPVGSAPEPANGAASKSRDGQTPPTRLLLTGSSHHFIGSIRPSVRPGHHGGTCHPPFTSTGEGVDQGRVQHLHGGGGLFHFLSKDKT